MAHNNGMVPRAKKLRASKGMQDAATKYQAAVDSLSVFRLEGDPAIREWSPILWIDNLR